MRHDYERRLDELTNGLRAHAATIAGKLHEDRAEHAALSERATAAREALAEAELRHAVGEYDDERFQGERTRHASDLQAFELSLDAVTERIARLEEVHALVTRAPSPVLELDDEQARPTEIESDRDSTGGRRGGRGRDGGDRRNDHRHGGGRMSR